MIVRDEAPAIKVYENDFTLAFMDIMPQVDGHTLVIPKAPAEDLHDLDPEMLAETIKTTQLVAAFSFTFPYPAKVSGH
jgi:histidine triad (HIT) family protein